MMIHCLIIIIICNSYHCRKGYSHFFRGSYRDWVSDGRSSCQVRRPDRGRKRDAPGWYVIYLFVWALFVCDVLLNCVRDHAVTL